MAGSISLGDHQQVQLGPVGGLDAAGNPTSPGTLTFTSSDTTVLTVAPLAADPTSALVKAVGKLGNAQISVAAGTGVTPAILNFTVVGEAAVSLSVPVSTPTEQT